MKLSTSKASAKLFALTTILILAVVAVGYNTFAILLAAGILVNVGLIIDPAVGAILM